MKYILSISLLMLMTSFVSEAIGQDVVYQRVENQPVFGNCEGLKRSDPSIDECSLENLFEYLTGCPYPEEAKKSKIEGKVYVRFIVEKDGSISTVSIERGEHKTLNKAAIDRISNMPTWLPGLQDGTPVRVSMVAPFDFKLPDPEEVKKEK